MNRSIIMLGCFDTKGDEFNYLYDSLKMYNDHIVTINTGVMNTNVPFPVDYTSEQVASRAGTSIHELRINGDRGYAVHKMGIGAAAIVTELAQKNQILAAIGMGGGGGTFLALTAMQSIPLGIPKLCLSTLAGKDVSRQTGSKDITLMPSIVDIAGLNSINKLLISQAAAAISGMARVGIPENTGAFGKIAITMFGNTSACVGICSELLKVEGYEVFVFHANGAGGKNMESLIDEHCFDAVLDITTTELADDLCGGICSAGPERLKAASRVGIPQVVVPGCMDMVNFSHPDTVPDKYKQRDLYSWAPDVTLMRTNEEENRILGETLVSRLKQSTAPVTIVIPNKGVSQIDREGDVFYRPQINRVLFDSIKQHVSGNIKVIEADVHINDKMFAEVLVKQLLDSMFTS